MVTQMRALENLRDNASPEEDDWSESVRVILNFQREDGSFSFVSDYDIPATLASSTSAVAQGATPSRSSRRASRSTQ